ISASVPNGGSANVDACLEGSPNFILISKTVSGGDGDGSIEADECNDLQVSIQNFGCHDATGVSAVLASSTPGVTITQPNSPYADTVIDQKVSNDVNFSVSTSSSFVCGTTINFTLTVTSAEGSSNVIPFSIPSCISAPVTISGALTLDDLQQTAR